ncbi:hypothetical protein Cantr_03015 [Candida viswanathii]|uniref:Zn(2)-C6 fungal-type domain-containing protein n=1 Tax=Candida viswanathii TaxID=5486 RepID=A0A367YM19_9ASCO|nr:hypothetical protein Cantr_03015 [Candida viswanathii]
MPTTNRRSRLRRCLSCRQLKIGCDRGRPCEYCVHTNRECVYEHDLPVEVDPQPEQEDGEVVATSRSIAAPSVSNVQHETVGDLIPTPTTYTGPQEEEDYVKDSTHIEEIPKPRTLTNATSILQISRFELYLTDFFKERGQYIFNFNNRAFMRVWFIELPLTFARSALVKQSYYAFSSLMLYHCLKPQVVKDIATATGISSSLLATNNFISPSQRQQLKIMSMQYFDGAVVEMRKLLDNSRLVDGSYPLQVANQLFFGLIFQFTILAYDHLQVPLLSFDKMELDYITLCESYKIVISKCIKPILNSPLRELFLYRMVKSTVPPENQVISPIIVSLRDDLEELRTMYLENPGFMRQHEVYKGAIGEMRQGIFSTAMCKYPFPFMLCCLDFSSDLRRLMYEGQYFALRLLFVYASLCIFCKFYMERDANLWTDYIIWYKERATFLDGGLDKELDLCLYKLVTESDFILKYANFETFNPITEWRKIESAR